MKIPSFKSFFLLSVVLYSALFFGTESVSAYSVPYTYAEHSYLSSYSQSSYYTSDGGGNFCCSIDGGDPSGNFNVTFTGNNPPPNGGSFMDNDDSGGLSIGDTYNNPNGGGSQGSSGDTPGGPSQGSYGPYCEDYGFSVPCCTLHNTCPSPYSQSTYYLQSAYEDTPTTTPKVDPTTPAVSLYIQKQGTTGWSKNMVGSPSDEVTLRWVVARANYCQSTDTTLYTVSDTTGVSGSTNNVEEPVTGQRVYRIECRNAAGTTARSSASLTVSATPITFTANPKIVRTGENSTLTWNVYGRTGCTTAKKSNGTDSSTDIPSTGSRDTEPLLGETAYRLSCPDGAQAEATIRVLPIYSET